ncbi:MAG: hypothetical protein HY211_02490 [Candidatus Omnitrophica bacterium]|nr:hypothetical protein [Candidatus Omnitrophota bacterium]
MNQRQINRFFRVLSIQLDEPSVVILTGAAAGSLLGHSRSSLDIDFAIRPSRRGRRRWMKIEEAVGRTIRLTGIQANFAEDIDRWGVISLMDYRRRTIPYRHFGKLKICLLDPVYWSIGKMSRYLEPDVQDLIAVFKSRKISGNRLVQVWARALRASPPSTGVSQFRRQVENFLGTYGRTIWGKQFDPGQAIHRFRQLAGII